MESSPRTTSMIVRDLQQRLETLQSTRIHDHSTLTNLESLLNDCSTHLTRLLSSSDSAVLGILLPSLLHTIISLSKLCSEKSTGSHLSQDKLSSLAAQTKALYNQIKEFFKTPKVQTLLTGSPEERYFCEQIHQICESIATIDIVLTLICHKLIIKLLMGGDEQSQTSSTKIDNINDGFLVRIYESVLRQMGIICTKYTRDCKDASLLKMYGIYFQMIHRLIQCPGTISQIESHHEFIQTMLQLHLCLKSTCQQNRFQLEYFNSSILLQEILQGFITHSSKLFFDELFLQISVHENKYAALVFLFRIIEAFDLYLSKQSNDISLYLIDQLISHLFNLIDQCQVQLVLPALLPTSFSKTQVEYGSLYDISYSLLMKLFHHQPMQTVLSSMTQLIQSSMISTSIQLASELIIQTWFFHHPSSQFQYLFGLFLAELLRLDIHAGLIHHLLSMPNIRPVKFRAYDALLSSDSFHRIYDFFSSIKDPLINSTNLSLIFPNHLDRLYPFVRLFNSELNIHQLQHTIDTCIYSIQQFLSLPMITELNCKNFITTLRLLSYLTINQNENFKCLLGQLTQIFILLDEQAAMNVRLELLRVFTVHSNQLDDNDLGRLFDYILTSSIELNSCSTAFHLGCLDLIDSLRQRPARSSNLTDLMIQLIVRYGNEHQCSHLLKAHLMRIFLAFISQGNDDTLPMRVKSQCILLRSSVDEFEKSKKSIDTTNERRFPEESILQVLASFRIPKNSLLNERDDQLKFYETIVNELQFHQCSISSNEMQQD